MIGLSVKNLYKIVIVVRLYSVKTLPAKDGLHKKEIHEANTCDRVIFLETQSFMPWKISASTRTRCASTAVLRLLGGAVCRLCEPPDQSCSRLELHTAGSDPLPTATARPNI